MDAGRKGFLEGTHRLVSPEQTLARVRPILGVMGITRVANLTGLDRVGLPVVMSYRPNARSLSVNSGKGLTLAAAEASGVMEAIESYHAERVHRPLVLGSYDELRFERPVVDVDTLPRLAVSTFHASKPLLWTEGKDHVTGAPVWVPFEMVHVNFTLPLPTGSGAFVMSSNGLASGNHPLEAIGHGLFEVVERDASTLFRLRRRAGHPVRRLNLDTVADPGCRDALARFDRAGVAVGVWDATSDVGIPVFHCIVVDTEAHPTHPGYATSGVGCHPCRTVALLRALTEAAQGRLIYIAGSRDDRDRATYAHARDPDFTDRTRGWVLADEDPRIDLADIPEFVGETFRADLDWSIERLRAVGVEQVISVDLSRDPFDIPVFRVIIPGLEAMQELPGYTPGPRARALRP